MAALSDIGKARILSFPGPSLSIFLGVFDVHHPFLISVEENHKDVTKCPPPVEIRNHFLPSKMKNTDSIMM
jgi:hypothetical protein